MFLTILGAVVLILIVGAIIYTFGAYLLGIIMLIALLVGLVVLATSC